MKNCSNFNILFTLSYEKYSQTKLYSRYERNFEFYTIRFSTEKIASCITHYILHTHKFSLKSRLNFPVRYPIFKYLCIEYEICNIFKYVSKN